jgi:hypothetical protein
MSIQLFKRRGTIIMPWRRHCHTWSPWKRGEYVTPGHLQDMWDRIRRRYYVNRFEWYCNCLAIGCNAGRKKVGTDTEIVRRYGRVPLPPPPRSPCHHQWQAWHHDGAIRRIPKTPGYPADGTYYLWRRGCILCPEKEAVFDDLEQSRITRHRH